MDYTTVANVKEYLNLQTDADDAVLGRLVTACTAAIDTILSRSIGSATYTDIMDGTSSGDAWGRNHIFLKNYPVISVTSVAIDGVTIPPSPDGIKPGWVLVEDMVELIAYSTSEGIGNVKVVYQGGFTTVPADIESVAIQLVAIRFRERTRLGVSSENQAGMTRSYSGELPPWCDKILNQYGDVVPR